MAEEANTSAAAPAAPEGAEAPKKTVAGKKKATKK